MTHDEFLEELLSLDPERLAQGLPAHLQAAADADPALAAEVVALQRMDQALPEMGRLDLGDAFFTRQARKVGEAVEARREAEARPAWSAPSGSLVLLLGVVGAYTFAGVEGGLLGTLHASATGLPLGGPDPMVAFMAVYACLFLLALYIFHLDGAEARPATVRVTAEA